MHFNEETTKKIEKVRYHLDEGTNDIYFSIIDIIDVLGLSTDPRNYWKVLKNRLKKADNELVANCSQVKMKSSDGKYYLTDAATYTVLLKIIEAMFPDKVVLLESVCNHTEKRKDNTKSMSADEKDANVSLDTDNDGEILVDAYVKDNFIIIKAMLGGTDKRGIIISTTSKELILKIDRTRSDNIRDEQYYCQELNFGKFGRTIELPYEVDIDNVEADESLGLLTIKLPIIDKDRSKIIKVK